MKAGKEHFGVSNLEYDIVTTLSNLLQAEEALTKYANDAEQAGENDCAEIFRMIQQSNRQAAMQLRDMMAKKVAVAA
jgi:rubrerythrin